MLLNASSNAIGQCLIPTDIDTAIDIDTDTYICVATQRRRLVNALTKKMRKSYCNAHLANSNSRQQDDNSQQ